MTTVGDSSIERDQLSERTLIEHLARQAPTQRFDFTENTLDYLLPLMQRRELDMIVCRLESPALTSGFTLTELYSDEILVVAPEGHPLNRRSRVTWRDAAAWPWIMPSMGSPMRTTLEVEFATAGVAAPHVLMESTSHLTICAVTRRVPCLFVSTGLRRGETDLNGELRVLPLKVSTAAQRIGALTAEPQSTAVSLVLAALKTASSQSPLPL